MKHIKVHLDDELYERIEKRCKAKQIVMPDLLSLWLWDYEFRIRETERRGDDISTREETSKQAQG